MACAEEGAVEQVGGVDGASAEHGEEFAKVGFALAGVVQRGVAGFAFEANLHFFFHAMAFERGNGEAIDEVSFAMAAWFIGVVKGLADGLKLGLVCLADVINGGIAVLEALAAERRLAYDMIPGSFLHACKVSKEGDNNAINSVIGH